MSVFPIPQGHALRRGLIAIALCVTTSPAVAGSMSFVSTLCHDPDRKGREIRQTLEVAGWQQAVVDRDGLYTDLATVMVLEITDSATALDDRFAQAPHLASNFEQMVLSGTARTYQREGALLFVSARLRPEGGEQVTCILGNPPDPETLTLMAHHGGSVDDAPTPRIVTRVTEEDGAGLRSMRLWSRLTHEPAPTSLTDLFYMERLTPESR